MRHDNAFLDLIVLTFILDSHIFFIIHTNVSCRLPATSILPKLDAMSRQFSAPKAIAAYQNPFRIGIHLAYGEPSNFFR